MNFYDFGRGICNVAFSLYFNIQIKGKENLPKDKKGFIVISNHRSYLDPVMIGIKIKQHRLTFMAKAELFRVPVLGPIIRKLGAFPVERGSKDSRKALETAKRVVKEDKVLALFPEGRRSKTDKLLKPKSGAIVVAEQTKAPIIPTIVCYKGKYPRAKVVVRYGELIKNEDIVMEDASSTKEIKAMTKKVWGKLQAMYEEEQENM